MATQAPTQPTAERKNVVSMSWDPITRIVGNLGIYTKIDFDNNQVVECKSTSSIFRGYSVFMRGKDPRDAHFITSRICGICEPATVEADPDGRISLSAPVAGALDEAIRMIESLVTELTLERDPRICGGRPDQDCERSQA